MDIWDRIDQLVTNQSELINDQSKADSAAYPKTYAASKKSIRKARPRYDAELHIIISRKHTYIRLENLDYQIIKKIKNYLTIRDPTILGYVKQTHCFSHVGDRCYIPRFTAFLLRDKFHEVRIDCSIRRENPIEMKFCGSPTKLQKIILGEILNKFANPDMGQCGLILNLQAGYGKTYLTMSLIAKLQLRTLIVVHNKTILRQWYELLGTNFPENKIARYSGEKREFGDIVVGIINSLNMPIEGFASNREFFNKFDMVVFDECHEYCSPGRSKIFEICQAPYMLGLSATPDERNDNLSKIIRWNIGPILIAADLPGYTAEEAPFKGHVIQVQYCGPPQYTQTILNEKLETVSATKMIEQFTQDPYRTKIICDLIMEFYTRGRNIFVFADRRNFLELINTQLQMLCACTSHMLTSDSELASIRLVGGSSAAEMTTAIESKRIILTTYAYMGTGCSIPKMDCIILATPRKSKSRQIINRIFRLGSDYSIIRQIIDIVDWKTPLKNQYWARAQYYKSQGFTIEKRIIKIDSSGHAKMEKNKNGKKENSE